MQSLYITEPSFRGHHRDQDKSPLNGIFLPKKAAALNKDRIYFFFRLFEWRGPLNGETSLFVILVRQKKGFLLYK